MPDSRRERVTRASRCTAAALLLAASFVGPGAEWAFAQSETARKLATSANDRAGLIIFARVATRDMKRVPDGAQNRLEWLVGGLYDFLQRIIGPELVKRTSRFFATVFIFILSADWVGLIPGVDTIGWGHRTAVGFVIDQPPFSVAQAFTGREGKQVPVADTVRGFEEILEGKHDTAAEGDFYMKGRIDEVKAS